MMGCEKADALPCVIKRLLLFVPGGIRTPAAPCFGGNWTATVADAADCGCPPLLVRFNSRCRETKKEQS